MVEIDEKYIEELEKDYKRRYNEWVNSHQLYGKPNNNELKYYTMIRILNTIGYDVEEYVNQQLLIKNKYIITMNNRWRIKGKNRWYWYKDVNTLFNKVLK